MEGVLPYDAVKDLPGLRLSPPGVIPQHNRRPRWVVDFTHSGVNAETVPIADSSSMQFGRALERIIRHIVLANPDLGPVFLIKVDVSDGFYRIDLRPTDVPKLGVVFPLEPGEEPMVAFPMCLPMGWTMSPPIFTTATETVVDITNQDLHQLWQAPRHKFDDRAEALEIKGKADNGEVIGVTDSEGVTEGDGVGGGEGVGEGFTEGDGLGGGEGVGEGVGGCERVGEGRSTIPPPTLPSAVPLPTHRDPMLPQPKQALATADVFVDDIIGLAQGSRKRRRRVRRVIFHALDKVFRPLDSLDSPHRKEPLSLSKLDEGDCCWSTRKQILGWVIDTVALTISLPQRRVDRLTEILNSIPLSQKRISVDKWHKVLGELRSMSIALPGSRGLFSHMQEALRHVSGKRLNLNKGIHQALQDFRWLLRDIAERPTRLPELVSFRSLHSWIS